MHVKSECRKNKCTRERRGLRGCERKAAVACVQFCDCVIKFQESKSCGQCRSYSQRANIISGLRF